MNLGSHMLALFAALVASPANASTEVVGGAQASAPGQTSDEPSEFTQFVIAHLPLIDRFEASRLGSKGEVPQELLSEDYHFARFPGGDERVDIIQLNDALEGCTPTDRMNANSVSITIHYDCPNRQRARLVYNFSGGRISRILVGDIPQELRCIDGLCIDKAEK